MILEVLTGECEELRTESVPVSGLDRQIALLATDLVDTMQAHHMASLSAPQCNKPIRMFVTDVGGNQQVWINPVVLHSEGEQVSVESCASFPEVTLELRRPQTLTVRCIDVNGGSLEQTVSGVLARLVAHEMDHLDGVLYQDRMDSSELFEQMLRGVGDMSSEPSDEDEADFDPAESTAAFATDDELRQILDLLSDGVWKIALAGELIKEYELDEEDESELQVLLQQEESLSRSLAYFETLFGPEPSDNEN